MTNIPRAFDGVKVALRTGKGVTGSPLRPTRPGLLTGSSWCRTGFRSWTDHDTEANVARDCRGAARGIRGLQPDPDKVTRC